MKEINPVIVALAKTRLTIDIEDCEVNISGMIRCDGENSNTGGVHIYKE